MSRTIKDLPFYYWQAELCRTPYPPDGHGHLTWREWQTRRAVYPIHPAHGGYREKLTALDRRNRHHRYRAHVRDLIRHGDYDRIEPARHLTGWHW